MTWLDLPAHHPFGVHNLPYGVFSTGGADRRIGVRVGDHVLDLAACAERAGMESAAVGGPVRQPLPRPGTRGVGLGQDLARRAATNEAHRDAVQPHLLPVADVTMHLPIEVADYVDFYASEHHATNVGRMSAWIRSR